MATDCSRIEQAIILGFVKVGEWSLTVLEYSKL